MARVNSDHLKVRWWEFVGPFLVTMAVLQYGAKLDIYLTIVVSSLLGVLSQILCELVRIRMLLVSERFRAYGVFEDDR